MKCGGTNSKGQPCGAPSDFVDEATGFCPAHDPERKEHMQQVASRGGKAVAQKHKRPPLEDRDPPPAPESIQDAKEFLSWTARNLALGVISDKEARALGYVLRSFVDSVERADVQEELEELREKLAALREGKLEDIEDVTKEVA